MEPRVSVIVPTFNRALWLEDAVRSILAQTLTALEVLVVDDGSTDGTADVIRRLEGDPRVRGLRQPHRGISAAMNLGLGAARGAYVARLDSDDLWLPDLLATEAAVLDGQPDVDVVYARGQLMDAAGAPMDEVWGHAPRFAGSFLRSMLYSDFTCNITVLARRACLDSVGPYDGSLQTSEDFDLWLRVAVAHRFAFVDRVLARVRIHGENVSLAAERFAKNREQRERVLDKLFARADLPADARAMRASAYANLHTETALHLWHRGRHGQALRALRRALAEGSARPWLLARFGFFALGGGPLGQQAWWAELARLAARARHRWRNRRAWRDAQAKP